MLLCGPSVCANGFISGFADTLVTAFGKQTICGFSYFMKVTSSLFWIFLS
jgi:hypothetical protein